VCFVKMVLEQKVKRNLESFQKRIKSLE